MTTFVFPQYDGKLYESYRQNEHPTVTKVLKVVNEDDDLPVLNAQTLSCILHDIGFVYLKRNRQSIIIDREDFQIWCHRYLRCIRECRNQNRMVRNIEIGS